MRRSLAFCLLLLLAGCAPTLVPRDPAEPLFLRVLEGTAAERTEAMAVLKEKYPADPWTVRARIVSDLHRQRDASAQKLRAMEQERSRCKQENQTLSAEAARLDLETARLREDLAKLKHLLIDMEKRARR